MLPYIYLDVVEQSLLRHSRGISITLEVLYCTQFVYNKLMIIFFFSFIAGV